MSAVWVAVGVVVVGLVVALLARLVRPAGPREGAGERRWDGRRWVVLPAPGDRPRFERERVVVTLKSGAAYSGVLYEADERHWVLKGAVGLAAGDNRTDVPVDGELLLFTRDIDYAQKP